MQGKQLHIHGKHKPKKSWMRTESQDLVFRRDKVLRLPESGEDSGSSITSLRRLVNNSQNERKFLENMKYIKNLFATLTAMFTILCMIGVTAFADGATVSFAGDKDISDHEFEAFQVFTGELSDDGTTLSNIEWGDGVNVTDLITALLGDDTVGSYFTGINAEDTTATARSVAKAIETATTATDDLSTEDVTTNKNRIAEIIYDNRNEGSGEALSTEDDAENDLEIGYYLIVDVTENVMEDGVSVKAYNDLIRR